MMMIEPSSTVPLLSSWVYPSLLVLGWLTSFGLTGLVTQQLRRRQLLDRPNERSSHRMPTPRGGGWGILPPVLIGWAALAWAMGELAVTGPALLACLLLALICWADDLHTVPPMQRLLGQALAVTAGLLALPPDALIFQGLLPLPLDRLIAGLGWVWWVNLYNFMDGIDGISGTETLSIAGGLVLLLLWLGLDTSLGASAALLAGVSLGFLAWNWHPARLFLGDVGSVPLGYLTGWLLLVLAVSGLWLPALLLPLYYAADGTFTLFRRLWRRERVWEPHRQHFYQQAVDRGVPHDRVVLAILAVNLVLAGIALISLDSPWAALAGPLAVAGLLLWMRRR
jgi:UDP-N-acetylmuramyl pentapeptide phosphotransferase/UDP-N-acetylglucosamine-1-phosphate transferase